MIKKKKKNQLLVLRPLTAININIFPTGLIAKYKQLVTINANKVAVQANKSTSSKSTPRQHKQQTIEPT